MKSIVQILIPLVVLATMSACSEKVSEQGRVLTVKVDTVRSFNNQSLSSFPGRIKAASDANLAFREAGTLLKVPVNAGSHVRKGDLLAELDPRDYQIQLSATEAEYKKIKGEVDRIVKLYERNSIPQNDYEKAIYGLQQIEAKYNAHKNALIDTRLYAPFDGFVQKRIFEEGETVGAGMPVVSMINANGVEVEIFIPSGEYLERKNFESFTCIIDVFGKKEFPLEMLSINHNANLNQLYNMRFKIKGIDEQSMPTPGMSATVNIRHKSEVSNETVVPLTAVFLSDDSSAVWVYNQSTSTVELRKVKVSEILNDGTMVISEGLKTGEVIVAAGVHSLSQGQQVNMLKPTTKTNVGGLL